jgi:trigger factor
MTTATSNNVDKLQSKRLSEKGCAVRVEVKAPVDFVNHTFQDAMVQVQSRVQIPGFRKGKAPLNLVRDNFGAMVKERAFDNAVRHAVSFAVGVEKLAPVASPTLAKCEFDENKPFMAEFEFEIAPKVDLKNYSKIPLVSKKIDVSEDKIKGAISEVLDQNARLEAEGADAALEENHFAIVDYKAFNPGETEPAHSAGGEMVEMSAQQTIPGLVEALKGAKRGDTREFDSEVNGKKLHFAVTIVEIKKKALPALNDDFAKEMGFESEAKFRDHVKGALQRQEEENSRRDTLRQLEDFLIKQHEFDLPVSLVQHHLGLAVERLMERMLPEERAKMNEEQVKKLGEKLQPSIERDMRVGYIMHAIAVAEKLEAGEKDFQEEMEKAVDRATTDEERLRVRRFFETRRPDIIATLTEHKVEDYLRKNAVITEA